MAYESFEDFVTRGSPRLLGAALLLAGDRSTAEDLTQETLIRMYRAWKAIRADQAVDSYAYRTLVRLAHRRRLRASTRNEIPTEQLPEPLAQPSDDDDDLRRLVDGQISRLPPRQRDTLTLRFYAGLSVEQTAKVMGCSTGTVKSQTAKGVQNLRALVASQQPTGTRPAGRRT